MLHNFRSVRLLATASSAALVFSMSFASAQELENFTFMFPVDSVNQYHPFFIADELGFYAEEGLRVTFQDAGGSSAAVQQVIAGNADAALPAPSAFLNAVAQGFDLTWVYSYQYANIFTLAATAESGIEGIQDLRGKRVGVSDLSGGEVPLVRAVLDSAGLTQGVDVQIIPVGSGSALTVNALETGQVDAYSSNLFEMAVIQASGIDMVTILPQEAQDFPANGVVVSRQMLENNREKIEGFLRASAKGVAFAAANDERAYEIASQISPEEFEVEAIAGPAWEVARQLKTPPAALADAPFGTHYVTGFQNFHDFLRQGTEEEGALPVDVDLSIALDSSLIDAANDFDRAAVEAMQ
ncbi:NitT/TauT family transport system substrate-binding protein [Roseinatronobacter thiooxidans]|uniref:NitT/TauT family transport system substrate-binding protein n=1 Tax=Roseinatronobacter thiooxidans TaxID=121821 RepID=A0A2W7PMI5_9RHOB|nr:ABC transporter substrate-binding protein [Roseinatronobacter thiooxidans]PZX36766.1 NitT/TauT family transport system substrate-binding protein [Roseinatronobacter thiooxidans]